MTRLFRDLLVSTAALTASTDAFGGTPQPQQLTFLTRFETADDCIRTICSQEYYDTVFRVTNVEPDEIQYSPDPPNTYHATTTAPQQISYRRRPTLAGFPIPIPKLDFCETWHRVCGGDTHDSLSVHVRTDMMSFTVDMSFAETDDGVMVVLDGIWESGTGIIAPFFGSIIGQMQDTMGMILGEN